MKTYKQLLQEALDLQKMSKRNFEDSVDATKFMVAIAGLLKSKALLDWADVTDNNYNTSTYPMLKKISAQYDAFLDAMDNGM